jgi:hypothetical protein
MPAVDTVPGVIRMNQSRAGLPSGCISLLGGPLLAFGAWMIAQALLLPHEAETVRLSVITGAFAAGLGAWLLAHRLRRASARPDPASAPAPQPAAGEPGSMGEERSVFETLHPGIGCLLVSMGFMLVGPLLLYLYFSGAPTKRGNPVMGLVAGILFSLLGLLGFYGVISGRRRNPPGAS